MIPPCAMPPPPWYRSPRTNRPMILRLSLSCTKVSFIPSSFAPPHPKQRFSGLGASVVVDWLLSDVLSVLFTRIPLGQGHCGCVTLMQRGCARHGAHRAGAYAFRCVAIPLRSQRRGRSAFRPNRQNPVAAYWAEGFAHKNNGRVRRVLLALWNESAVRWRQTPEAIPATGTCHLRDESSASLRACVCEELHPAPPGVRRKPCASWLHVWRTFRAARIRRAWPAPIDPCADRSFASRRATARWPKQAPRSIRRAAPGRQLSRNCRCG